MVAGWWLGGSLCKAILVSKAKFSSGKLWLSSRFDNFDTDRAYLLWF